MGVIADQFYAERLYTRASIGKLLEKTGFRNVRHHGHAEALSDRDQDLGMMARRILLSADAPHLPVRKKGKLQALDVTVLMGDHRLPDQVKRGGAFNPEDIDTIRKLKDALAELPNYKFRFLDNHGTLERDLSELRTDLIFNLCDEGFNNDPFKELHVPAMLEVLGIGYTGAGPAALAACYDKGLVRAVAQSLDVPVPLESYVRRATRVRRCRRYSRLCSSRTRATAARASQRTRWSPMRRRCSIRSTGCAPTSPSAVCWCRNS
jgi:D-alanine-D-alanine ligase